MHIQKLKIYTTGLSEQIRFYSTTLGLDIINQDDDSISFKIGSSILILESTTEIKPYHFAINIPCNQIEEALKWVKNRVDILKFEDVEIHDFATWHAQAVYFYDKDNNIVELIARQNLHNGSDENFSKQSFLEISEIGLPVDDITPVYKLINESTGMVIYSGDKDRFCAIGSEHGLFICINKNNKDWYPSMDKAFSSAFELQFSRNEKEWFMEFTHEKPYILTLK